MDSIPPAALASSRCALIADDDPAFRLLLNAALTRLGFEVTITADGLTALERALEKRFDLVVLDVLMPGADGFEVCKALRAMPAYRRTPILMATGLEDHVSVGRAFEAGASDFERKPLQVTLLGHRIMFLMKSAENLRELEDKRVELEFSATHDTLTGLPNRAGMARHLSERISADSARGRQTAVLYIDLDGFKNVNDALGHPFGDRLLREIVERMRAALPERYMLARVGGDEFVLIVDGLTTLAQAETVAGEVMSAFEQPFTLEKYEFPIGASIGICVHPIHGDTVDELIRNADLAMYRAKRLGRKRYHVFDEKISLELLERMALQSELLGAIARGELLLLFQPTVELASGRILGAEALVRWNHPVRGLLEPSAFLPIAEESGLIPEIGQWVLERAAAMASRWCRPPFSLEHVSVNLSGPQIWRSDFVARVRDLMLRAGIEPSMLQLEVSEALAMDSSNRDETLESLETLGRLGMLFAIDDFGTGQSSIPHLRRLPLSHLKIDLSFVREITTAPDDRSVVHAMIAIGRSLGLTVVAEGIETPGQLHSLLEAGCALGQGYLFSRPVPLAEFEALLDANARSTRASPPRSGTEAIFSGTK